MFGKNQVTKRLHEPCASNSVVSILPHTLFMEPRSAHPGPLDKVVIDSEASFSSTQVSVDLFKYEILPTF